ncbi:AHH domain-containing protein [Actinopolymorpha singaporensis]|uniref:A nuclease family of the HNH/ENDO VII superfamily with conserved AHH n=1 Tax=Actinopolymorpha singaporensis TaxID=117157 RepID=A0A1H1RS85_9ACTN|nr:AHH domain-containing protein [Actinopolymorpha singaporensis]SDS37889.1 A nuclease family of the HNH/ENDO VII superfamily with conserved AHH [Actinopolymorpha singaporensis]
MASVPKSALLAAAKRAKITEAAADLLRLVEKKYLSKNLGHNLEVAGRRGMKDAAGKLTDDAAHLVPKASNYVSARRARAILEKYKIHLDEPVNGSWLPHGRDASKYPNPFSKSPHQATHSRAYYDALWGLLRRCKNEDQVVAVLNYVRAQLDKGIWP